MANKIPKELRQMAADIATTGIKENAAEIREALGIEPQTEEEKARRELLIRLEELGGKLGNEDSIAHGGKKLMIPDGMTKIEAHDFLGKVIEAEEQNTTFQRSFNYRPWDGARAFKIVVNKYFGAYIGKTRRSFWGNTPPQMITINTGVRKTEQVPWGDVELPIFSNSTITLGSTEHAEYGPLFHLYASCPQKHRWHIEGLVRALENELEANSMYRGQAITGADEPEFMDLNVDEAQVIYTPQVEDQLHVNVWAPLQYSDEFRQRGIPLKRSVLFSGGYGTGKTLAAMLTGQRATQNKWGFIYCRPGKDNAQRVLQTARLYEPCVVFIEDVDTVAAGGTASIAASAFLDAFDGVSSKTRGIMAVLTTNHAKNIHKGMLRPGRLDAVIDFDENWTATEFRRLVEAVVEETMRGEIDYEVVAESMVGYSPAYIREALDRARRYSLAHHGGVMSRITTSDITAAAYQLATQKRLMESSEDQPMPESTEASLRRVAVEALKQVLPAFSTGHGWNLNPKVFNETIENATKNGVVAK